MTKSHIKSALASFERGCDRARALTAIYQLLSKIGPPALDSDDILRSALVLSVSSLDLYMHDVLRLETLHRLAHKKPVNMLRVPFSSLVIDVQEQHGVIDESIRRDHSFKSFVAPDKFAECLKHLIADPWKETAKYNYESESACKARLKSIVDLRNRIAHEADVNPEYGGINLWPIYFDDVVSSIDFICGLGKSISMAVDLS